MDNNKMQYAVREARKHSMLQVDSGGVTPLLLCPDVYDDEWIGIYEPLCLSELTVWNIGSILRDALSKPIQDMLKDGEVVAVRFDVVGSIKPEGVQ